MRVRNEHGGSLVEFAIILPILLIIVFGIIEFGILLYDKAMLTYASREGARFGIVYRFDPALPNPRVSAGEIIDEVNRRLENGRLLISLASSSGLQIPQPIWSGTEAGDTLTVTVNYQYRFLVLSNLMALSGSDLLNPLNLSAVTRMRLE